MKVSRWLGMAVAAVLSCGTVANAGLITVFLDAASQNGGTSGNFGFSYIPADSLGQPAPLVLTAGSLTDTTVPFHFDPFAPTTPATIFLNGFGGGVQDQLGFGSELISGLLGGSVIEQLVLTFDDPATTTGLVLTLGDYRALSGPPSQRDIPAIFVHLVGGTVLTFDQTSISEPAANTGILDLSTLLAPGALVEQIVVRETKNHFALNSISFTPIPAPGSVALLALAGLLPCQRRRRLA
ncbi:MAG: hypothetical protein IH830_04180 [Planctomycetes bacterium]|nr:hypothetical protein [Planctomycetota bacterium]